MTTLSKMESPLQVQRDTRPLDLVASGPMSTVSLVQIRRGSRDSWQAWEWVVLGLWKVGVQSQEGESPSVVGGPEHKPLVEEVQLWAQFQQRNKKQKCCSE